MAACVFDPVLQGDARQTLRSVALLVGSHPDDQMPSVGVGEGCHGFGQFFVVDPVSASMRLQDRSLYMNSDSAGATTFYRLAFRYMSPDPVGSVELLFCDDPIPYNKTVFGLLQSRLLLQDLVSIETT